MLMNRIPPEGEFQPSKLSSDSLHQHHQLCVRTLPLWASPLHRCAWLHAVPNLHDTSAVLLTIAAIYSECTIFFTKSVVLLDCPVLILASNNQYLISFFFSPCLFDVEISPRPKNPLRNSTLTLTLLPEFSCLRL